MIEDIDVSPLFNFFSSWEPVYLFLVISSPPDMTNHEMLFSLFEQFLASKYFCFSRVGVGVGVHEFVAL